MLTLISAALLYRSRSLLLRHRGLACLIGCCAALFFATFAFGFQEPVRRGAVVQEVLPQPPAAVAADMPPSALQAVDAMFQAGGYPQAAREYARLSLRFGASDQLYGRRFIAQVMSCDFEQALVINSSARLTANKISRENLPGKSLAGLNLRPAQISSTTELLASRVMLDARDADRLDMMATWLLLTGDAKRGGLFARQAVELRRAAQEAAGRLDSMSLVEPR